MEISRSGPDHKPIFEIEVRLENGAKAVATSSSKRNAQQKAARILLEKMLDE